MKLTHPRLELLSDWHHFRLLEPWICAWMHEGRFHVITIPEDFVTDLASVPKFLHLWISPTDLRHASLPHDLIYQHGGYIPGYYRISGRPCDIPWSRRDADRLFARIMREAGVGIVKRRAAYLAVRAFGRLPWTELEPKAV